MRLPLSSGRVWVQCRCVDGHRGRECARLLRGGTIPAARKAKGMGMQSLRVIVYVSAAVEKLGIAALEEMLQRARERNSKADTSGLLLYSDGNFLQYLEGPSSLVAPIWKSIQRDIRHRQLTVLVDRPASQREFEGWSMAYGAADLPAFLSLAQADWRAEVQRGSVAIGSDFSPGRRLIRAMWSAMLPGGAPEPN